MSICTSINTLGLTPNMHNLKFKREGVIAAHVGELLRIHSKSDLGTPICHVRFATKLEEPKFSSRQELIQKVERNALNRPI